MGRDANCVQRDPAWEYGMKHRQHAEARLGGRFLGSQLRPTPQASIGLCARSVPYGRTSKPA